MPASAALRLIASTVLTLSLMEYIFFSSLDSAIARLTRAIDSSRVSDSWPPVIVTEFFTLVSTIQQTE